MKYSCLTAFALIVSMLPLPVAADQNDFVLHRFRKCSKLAGPNCADGINWSGTPEVSKVNNVTPDQALFRELLTELGQVMGPKVMAPASTLGLAGFQFGFYPSFTNIDEGGEQWKKAMPTYGESPDSYLTVTSLHIRKGLPFSFELGAVLNHLLNSELFAIGAEARWALNEGYHFLPDLAVRGAVMRLLGSRDLDMVMGNTTLSLSKTFSIAGMSTLTPYAGWDMAIINGSSHVLDATPASPAFPSEEECRQQVGLCVQDVNNNTWSSATNDFNANFALSQERLYVHRGFVGLQSKFSIITLTGEIILAEQVETYSFKLALEF